MEYISVGKEKMHYLEWGTGKKLLLAFHGYGNDAAIFSPFSQYLSEEYTILSFDLPHHGNSTWTRDAVLTRKDLLSFVDIVKAKYKVDKISLLGYSMGGRVSLTIIQYMPSVIDKVVLIATDGLRIDYFYFFLTRTYVGKKIFKNELEKPARFFKVVDWLKRKKMLSAHKYKFVMNYMKPEDSRRFLMQVWPGMSDLMPFPPKLKRVVRDHHIPISIFMGIHDRIMPPALAEKFKTGLNSVQLFTLEKGHRVFDDSNIHHISERLL